MLWQLTYDEQYAGYDDDVGRRLDVNIAAVATSVAIAFVHLGFEVFLLAIESDAAKTTMMEYIRECLNARLNWVPLLNIILRENENHINAIRMNHHRFPEPVEVVDWEQMKYQFRSRRSKMKYDYTLDFEFGPGSFRFLYNQIMRLARFTDGSKTETKPLQTLLPDRYLDDRGGHGVHAVQWSDPFPYTLRRTRIWRT